MVEHRFVVPAVVGSSPIGHPRHRFLINQLAWRDWVVPAVVVFHPVPERSEWYWVHLPPHQGVVPYI